MIPMRTLVAAASLLALCACATAPRVSGSPSRVEHMVAIADLIGRTPAEVRQRLWAREPDHDYVSEARLTPEGEVLTRESLDMTRGGGLCATGSRPQFRLQGDQRLTSFPRFVFQDGRLQTLLSLTGDALIPAGGRITVTCQPQWKARSASSQQGTKFMDALAMATIRPPETSSFTDAGPWVI